ncbi:MAG: MFS transporter [Psychrobium sp.]
MKTTLISLISLFVSCFILFFANGLINVLLPVRMGLDGVNTDTIGMVLSLYFVGLIIGAIYSKNLIKKSGHIRMFAGCVALSAVSILVCSLYTDPVLWGLMRVLLGFCNACAFTAMESWLSDSATEENRGKLLSVYHGTALFGLFAGQFLMNAADPQESVLFVLAGIFLCMAVTPVVLSRHKGPQVEDVASMSIKRLVQISPLGMMTCFISGIVYASMFNLLPVFAKSSNIIAFDLSLYMGFAIFGAFIMQFPVGYLSDKYDRRTVLLGMISLSLLTAFLVTVSSGNGLSSMLVLATLITGGTLACLYPLSVSETLDKLKQSEMVAAMGTMILVQSIGGVIGPYTSSLIMKSIGANSLFYFIILIELFLAGFVLYRMSVRKALPVEEQEAFVMQSAVVAATASPALDPRTQFVEPEPRLSRQAKTAKDLAELDPAAAVKMARAIALDNPESGVEIARAIATVGGIDVLRFYEVMQEAAPFQMPEITQALVTTNPDHAYDLVSKLAQWHPTQVVNVAQQISESLPELRSEMAKVAVEHAPESAIQVAQYYAQVISDEQQALRPADREDDTSEEDALEIASQIWESAPEQAVDVAVAIADNLPESAVDIASELATNFHEPDSPIIDSAQQENESELAVELVQRLAEVTPENAAEVAGAVVDVVPEVASDIVEAISEGDKPKEGEWVDLIDDGSAQSKERD